MVSVVVEWSNTDINPLGWLGVLGADARTPDEKFNILFLFRLVGQRQSSLIGWRRPSVVAVLVAVSSMIFQCRQSAKRTENGKTEHGRYTGTASCVCHTIQTL